jgi:hypothetical protein
MKGKGNLDLHGRARCKHSSCYDCAWLCARLLCTCGHVLDPGGHCPFCGSRCAAGTCSGCGSREAVYRHSYCLTCWSKWWCDKHAEKIVIELSLKPSNKSSSKLSADCSLMSGKHILSTLLESGKGIEKMWDRLEFIVSQSQPAGPALRFASYDLWPHTQEEFETHLGPECCRFAWSTAPRVKSWVLKLVSPDGEVWNRNHVLPHSASSTAFAAKESTSQSSRDRGTLRLASMQRRYCDLSNDDEEY